MWRRNRRSNRSSCSSSLALAFGIASGLEPAGLYASIFGGLTAVFGGCGVQITGPTGAMTAVLLVSASMEWAACSGRRFGRLDAGGSGSFVSKFVKFFPACIAFTNGVSICFS